MTTMRVETFTALAPMRELATALAPPAAGQAACRRLLVGLLLLVSIARLPAIGDAQPAPLDRVVRANELGYPLVVRPPQSVDVAELSRATGVPMGFEMAWDRPPDPDRVVPRLTLTGLTLRDALQQIVLHDPRYEWRELDGVIVIRPRTLWASEASPLNASVTPIELVRTRAMTAFALAAGLLGGSQEEVGRASDTRTFALSFGGGTIMELLNAIVRAHGAMAWRFAPPELPMPPSAKSRFFLWFSGASDGWAIPVPADGRPVTLDVARFDLGAPRAPDRGATQALLQRVIPTIDGDPFTINGAWPLSLMKLASRMRFPAGFEALEPGPYVVPEITLTGRTLEEALNAIVRIDPRYEWRVIDGVVIVRPVSQWKADATGPLTTSLEALRAATSKDVLRALTLSRLLALAPPPGEGDALHPAAARASADAGAATLFDLLHEIVTSHGAMMWQLRPEKADETHDAGYTITMWTLTSRIGAEYRW